MEAQPHRIRVLGAEAGLHDLGPAAARGAELGDLLEEVALRDEIKGKPRREGVDVHAGFQHFLHVDDAVRQREGGLLQRRGAGLRDVVAGNIDRVVALHVLGAISDAVAHDAHRGRDRIAVFLLRHVLLQNVGLDRAGHLVEVVTALLAERDVHREQDPGARVDGHRNGDFLQIDALVQRLHVGQRVDGDALAADLAILVEQMAVLRVSAEPTTSPRVSATAKETRPTRAGIRARGLERHRAGERESVGRPQNWIHALAVDARPPARLGQLADRPQTRVGLVARERAGPRPLGVRRRGGRRRGERGKQHDQRCPLHGGQG